MHGAPPVAVILAEPYRERRVTAGLAALAAAASAAWVMDHAFDLQPAPVKASVVLSSALAGAVAGRWLWPAPRARSLRWDGRAWWLVGRDGTEKPVGLRLMVDAGAWLLLRAQGRGVASQRDPAHWLALARGECGGSWAPLRAALYCPVPDAADAAPLPPPDSPA